MENEKDNKSKGSFLTRRRMLQASAIGGAAAFAAACGTGGSSSDSAAPATDSANADGENKIVWANWPYYMPITEDGKFPDLEAFTAETGIKIDYQEVYNDNNEFYATAKIILDKGQALDYDLVTPTDWMAQLWIKNGYVQELDKANIPNAANLLASLANVSWDPERKYSLPYLSGFAGIGWNKAKLKEAIGTDTLTTMDQFFDPRLKGQVLVLSELRDTIPLILGWQGADPTNFTAEEFQKAIDYLQSQVDNKHIVEFNGNDYATKLEGKDVIAVIGWSGDLAQLGDEYGFDLPVTGGTIYVDNCVIPAGSTQKANVEKLLNYLYDPQVAASIAAGTGYISPVQGAAEVIAKTDPALAANPFVFPTPELLKRAFVTMPFTPEQQADFDAAWAKLIGN
jgi:spermidine/putrescine transport system substrate-binding protein